MENVDLLSALIDTFDSDEDELPDALPVGSQTSGSPIAADVSKNTPVSSMDVGKPSKSSTFSTTTASSTNLNGCKSSNRVLEECDIFSPENNSKSISTKELFGEESDDDDDELLSKTNLNENGADIRRLMKDREQQQSVKSASFYDRKATTAQIKNKWSGGARIAHNVNDSKAVKIPDLGINIVNPKVSMEFLKNAMATKERVKLARVGLRNPNNKEKGNWITIGVIASKTETKRTASGKEYIIMRLADMDSVDEEVSLFLFGSSYDRHWKLPVATAIGLMNPSIMKSDKSNARSAATINIHDEKQMLVIGTSKDFGTCGSVTKNGNKCTNVVNRAVCDKCRFHTLKEHKAKRQSRSELNSAFSGKEPSTVSQRLLSRLSTTKSADDCFTYGGQSFSTKAAKPKTKVSLNGVLNRSAQKGNLERTLSQFQIKADDQERISAAAAVKRTKAEERLEELVSRPTTASMQFMKHLVSKELKAGSVSNEKNITVTSVKPSELIRLEKAKFFKAKKPDTSSNSSRNEVELDVSTVKPDKTTMNASDYRKLMAKQKAKEVIMKDGGLKKEDANAIKKKLTPKQKEQMKRRYDQSVNTSNETCDLKSEEEKRRKLEKLDVNADPYLEIKNKKSINSHLVQQVEAERENQYFGILEKKESYETKLLDTHMIEAEIYYCAQCDYQDWRLAKRCYDEKHRYKKLPALKRFFKCKDCKERVVTHEKYPTTGCKKCGGTNYGKAGMIHEKKVVLAGQELSLRGNEESKLGSYDSTVNLDIV